MIEIKNLSKVYSSKGEGETRALNGVNLSIPDNGLTVISGNSGCGKTTLLNLIAGFDKPTEGAIFIDEEDISTYTEEQKDKYRLSKLGFVFQNFNLIDTLNVRENIELPLRMLGDSEDTIKEQTDIILEKMGLKEEAEKSTSHLSGGQKQRVAIARAMVKSPRLILADEPTGNLDEENSKMVFALLKEVSKECPVIVVTHDTYLADEYADNSIKISYGKIEKNEINSKDKSEKGLKKEIQNKGKLPQKLCFKLASTLIEARSARATVTVLILTITLTMAYLLTLYGSRKNELSLVKYFTSTNADVVYFYKQLGKEAAHINSITSSIDSGELIKKESSVFAGEQNVVYSTGSVVIAQYTVENVNVLGVDKNIKDGECIINRKLAEYLGISEKDLPYNLEIKFFPVKVTSIIENYKSVGADEKYTVLLSKNTLTEYVKDQIVKYGDLRGLYIYGLSKPENVAESSAAFGNSAEIGENLFAGNAALKKNEVVIPQNSVYASNKQAEDVVGSSISLFNLHDPKYLQAFEKSINLYDYCGSEVYITGTSNDGKYYFAPEVYQALLNDSVYYSMQYGIDIKAPGLSASIKKMIKNGYRFKDQKLTKLYEKWTSIDYTLNFFLYVLLALTILTILQMISLFTFSINDSRKLIGTLRSMGASARDVKEIFVFENVITTTISVILSVILSLVIVAVMNNRYSREMGFVGKMITIYPNAGALIAVCLFSVLVSLSVVLVPLHKFNKSQVNNLLQ